VDQAISSTTIIKLRGRCGQLLAQGLGRIRERQRRVRARTSPTARLWAIGRAVSSVGSSVRKRVATVARPVGVSVPAIAAWMVQWHDLTAHRIGHLDLVILVVIAALRCKREVLRRCRTTLGAWNDVLYGERLSGIAGLAATLLAASICA
jgi:hypothetical protein